MVLAKSLLVEMEPSPTGRALERLCHCDQGDPRVERKVTRFSSEKSRLERNKEKRLPESRLPEALFGIVFLSSLPRRQFADA